MENKLAEAINIVRGALVEIERREKAADAYIEERKKIADELVTSIAELNIEKASLEKTLAEAREATQAKLNVMKKAVESALKGI